MRPLLVLAVLILQPVASASAALIALDLFTAGDGLITRDTETNLDWLDLTATQNLSYNDIEADVGGWISLAFRHATGGEVCGLFAAHALAPSPCPGGIGISQPGNLVSTLQGFVGVTSFDPPRLIASDGLFDDGDVSDGVGFGRVALTRINFNFGSSDSNSNVFEDSTFASTALGGVGHWLVRPVPEPSTALLLAAGLAVFAVRRRRPELRRDIDRPRTVVRC